MQHTLQALFGGLMLGIVLLGMPSCEVINPEEDLPSYIYIDTMKVNTTSAQGTNSHQLTEAWVYINSNFVGAYDLPTRFPILDSGDRTINVFAGIKDNGSVNSRNVYPFHNIYTEDITLSPLSSDTIVPTFEYRPDTKFAFIEDFEQGNIFGEDLDGNDFTQVLITTDTVFEGNRAAWIHMEDTVLATSAATVFAFPLPTTGTPVYLELNYKNNVNLQVAVAGIINGQPQALDNLILTPKTEWSKVYFNITQNVVALKADEYKIVIGVDRTLDDPPANVFIDNVKLVHF